MKFSSGFFYSERKKVMSEFIERTISGQVEYIAEHYPDQPAVKYHKGFDYARTYAELDADCNRVAKAFLALGVKKGEHIAMWATNYPQWIMTLFGASKIGAVFVTVNTNYKIYEAEYLLKQSDSKVLVMNRGFKDCDYVEIMKELVPETSSCGDGEINSKRL